MHYSIKEHLEDYLANAARRDLPAGFYAHLESCPPCREELEHIQTHARMLQALRASQELDPPAGFYARVMERIVIERVASIWSALLEPAFVRRVVFASVVFLVLLTSYMVGTEPGESLAASSPEVIMASEPHSHELSGESPEQDREAVLLTLATYRE